MTAGILAPDRRSSPAFASDVARPRHPLPAVSDARPLCASAGAHEAHGGRFLPDCGDVAPRLASDIAAFLEKRPEHRTLDQRDRLIVRLVHGGAQLAAVGRLFGITKQRVHAICAQHFCPCERREARETADRKRIEARADACLMWHAAGLSNREIGAQLGLSDCTVGTALRTHTGYSPRRNPSPAEAWNGALPPWLPARHHDRFRRIAATEGEEAAATCLRKLKALEAQHGILGPVPAHQSRASHDTARAA